MPSAPASNKGFNISSLTETGLGKQGFPLELQDVIIFFAKLLRIVVCSMSIAMKSKFILENNSAID